VAFSFLPVLSRDHTEGMVVGVKMLLAEWLKIALGK